MLKDTDALRENTKPSRLSIFITAVICIAVLRYAQDLFIPIALATLLSFILAPLIVKLGHWKFPRPLAILTSVFFALILIVLLSGMVSLQVVHLLQDIPKYQANIHQKISSFKGMAPSALSELYKLNSSIEKDTASTPEVLDVNHTESKPIPVVVQDRSPTIFERIETILNPLIGPLGTGILTIIFLISILFQREDLRARFITLVSKGNLNRATQIIDDATQRITTYLLMNLIVNTAYGTAIGLGLYYLGVPNAVLWGFLATFLRFIPYLGTWLAASFPLLLAFAADPGWSLFFMTVALFLIIELITNNIIEPLLYGASTGISALALIVAAAFWTWLWGIVGLFLSVPLTVCLYILGKYVPGLEFLRILLGSEPVLNQVSALYQRLLAMDEEETLKLSKTFITKAQLIDYYDQLLIPAMNLAEEDRHNGALAEHRQKFILEYVGELIEIFGAEGDVNARTENEKEEEEEVKATIEKFSVICVPARDEADELVARMLAQLLNKEGISAHVIECGPLSDVNYKFLRSQQPKMICISSLPPFSVVPARQMCRKLKQILPKTNIMIGIWSLSANEAELMTRFGSYAFTVVTNLKDAMAKISNFMEPAAVSSAQTTDAPTNEIDHIDKRYKYLSLKGIHPDELFDLIAREVSKALEVPISLVTLVDRDPTFWKSLIDEPAEPNSPKEVAISDHITTRNEMLVIEDINKDSRYATNTWLKDRGIRFYAGTPLKTTNGQTVGVLCVIDTNPHSITDEHKQLLQTLVNEFMQKIESDL